MPTPLLNNLVMQFFVPLFCYLSLMLHDLAFLILLFDNHFLFITMIMHTQIHLSHIFHTVPWHSSLWF